MGDYIGRDNTETPGSLDCEQWQALLTEKMDRMDKPEERLPAEDEAAFAEHAGRCSGCRELLAQAQQGRQWLALLSEHTPAAPVHLLGKILVKTGGSGREMDRPLGTAALAGLPGIAGGVAFPGAGGVSRWFLPHRQALNARLLMTAAMAFFSIALTLSLVGIKITSVHAAELRPQTVEANMTRSFYGTKKQVVSFYENLRLVYEVESKMRDLRGQPASGPEAHPAPQSPASQPTVSQPPALQPKSRGGHADAGSGAVLHGFPLRVRAEVVSHLSGAMIAERKQI